MPFVYDCAVGLVISYQALLKDILNKWGVDLEGVPDGNIPYYFHDLILRMPASKKRKVEISDVIKASPEKLSKIVHLVKKLEGGESVWPHLSRGWKRLRNIDGLYNGWNIYHLHVGGDIEADGYVSRSKEVLLLQISDDVARLIDVRDHGKGHSDLWYDANLMNIALRNWPEWLVSYRCNVAAHNVATSSVENIKSNRRIGVNSAILLSDGNLYLPPGVVSVEGISSYGAMLYTGTVLRAFGVVGQVWKEAPDKLHREFFLWRTHSYPLDLYVSGVWPNLNIMATGSDKYIPIFDAYRFAKRVLG